MHIALGRKMRIGAGPGEPVYYSVEVSQLKALDLLTRKLLPTSPPRRLDAPGEALR